MGKNQENRDPYYVNMEISTEGLQNVPSEVKPHDVFMNVAINSIVSEGKKRGGLRMDEHSKLYKVRQDFMAAIKVNETSKAKIGYDEFKFLMSHWNKHTPEPQTNELVMRVWQKLKEAQERHGEDPEKEAGPVVPE